MALNDTKSLFSNYLHLITGNALGSNVVNFVSLFLIVRILSPAGYGSYVLFVSVASIIAIVTTWTSASIVRFGREEFIAEGSVRKTFWANYGILLPAFAVCFLLVFIFRTRLSDYIGISQSTYFLIFAHILLSNLALNISIAFQAMGKMKHFSYLPLASSGSFLVAIAIIYFMSVSVPVELAVGLLVFGLLLVSVIGFCLLWKDITPICVSRDWIKKCLSYSWPVFFGGTSGVMVQYIDQIVIRMFMALSFVGVYNVAYQLQGCLITLPMLSMSLMFPLMTSLVVTKEGNKLGQYIKVYAPQIAFFWALATSIFLVFAPEIVLLFGVDYIAASVPLRLLLFGMAFRIFAIIESPLIASYGLIKQAVVVNVGIALINLGLDFLLIPRMGISGAAVASVGAFIFGTLGYSFILIKWQGINDYRNYPWLFPAILAFVGSVFIDNWVARILLLAVVVAISFLVAKRSAVFNTESLAILDSIDMPSSVRRTVKQVYSILV